MGKFNEGDKIRFSSLDSDGSMRKSIGGYNDLIVAEVSDDTENSFSGPRKTGKQHLSICRRLSDGSMVYLCKIYDASCRPSYWSSDPDDYRHRDTFEDSWFEKR
jgi:hypothetical protein